MDRLREIAIVIVFFGGLLSAVFASTPIDNTIGGVRLFWVGAGIGVSCILLAVKLIVLNSSFADRMAQLIMLIIGLVLFGGSSACFINIKLSNPAQSVMRMQVLSKGRSGGKGPPEYYLFINTKNGEERVQVARDFWSSTHPNSVINATVIAGYFGFPYIIRVGDELKN